MDDLLHFVRHEVAMDGDDGTPIDRLDTFLETFYSRAADSKVGTNSSITPSISAQNIDESFKNFVWKQLASLPELKVAFLRKLGNENAAPTGTPDPGANGGTPTVESTAAGEASTPVPAPIPSTSTALLDDDGNPIDQGTFNLKNKAKIKAARKDDQSRWRDARLTGDQYEFVEIPQEEIQTSSREQLLEKYGSTLRIAADPETCYVALTGSHERFGKLTALAYQVLQAIARGREDGKTVIDLGKEFAHDQKSLFHFVKSLYELNLIVKMKVLDARSQTSRCIHRHYLETSQHWATWMTKDPNEATAKGEDNEDDMSRSTPLAFMTVAHINSNEPFVRSRIINALKASPDKMIPHADLVFAIGLHARPDREYRRRLNRIVTIMERQGLIEKVGVARQGAKGLLGCLKLPQNSELEGKDTTDGLEAIPSEEEDEIEQRPNILLTLPVERQVVDLIVSSGHQGLTIRELQASLGDVGIRSLETLLMRIEKNSEPPHLCDYSIQSVFETHGREKRLRYFTRAGYHERCRQDGLFELVKESDFSHPELAGGFSRVKPSEFYSTPEEFAKIADKMITSSSGKIRVKPKPKAKTNAKPKTKTPRDSSQPVKKGRPKGSTKAAKAAATATAIEAAANGDTPLQPDTSAATEEKPKKKRQRTAETGATGDGQPVGKKKRKLEKAQPAEGDPNPNPAPAVTGTNGANALEPANPIGDTAPPVKKKGRPKKAQPAEGEVLPTPAIPETNGANVVEPATPTGDVASVPKKKGRSKKVQSAEGEVNLILPSNETNSTDVLESAMPTSDVAPLPKKKGRPKKVQPVVEQPNPTPAVPKTDGTVALESATPTGDVAPIPKKKGRPSKVQPAAEESNSTPPVAETNGMNTTVSGQGVYTTPSHVSQATTSGTGPTAAEVTSIDKAAVNAVAASKAVSEPPTAENDSAVSTPSQPKKRGRPLKAHNDTPSEDGNDSNNKKYKAQLDENGKPIKGRPRKYPPGITSTQRKILLEERRAAGLEPPQKKKNKKNSAQIDAGSVQPSIETPAVETTVAPAKAGTTSADTSVNMAIDSPEIPAEPMMTSAAAAGAPAQSQASEVIAERIGTNDAAEDLPVPSDEVKMTTVMTEQPTSILPDVPKESPIAAESENISGPANTAGFTTERDVPVSSISQAKSLQATPGSNAAAPKKRGRPRKSEVAAAANLSGVQSAQQTPTAVGSIPGDIDVQDDVSGPDRRRSKRQKTAPVMPSVASVASTKPRSTRSSRIKPDTPIKIEDVPLASLEAQEEPTDSTHEHNETHISQEVAPGGLAPDTTTLAEDSMSFPEVAQTASDQTTTSGTSVPGQLYQENDTLALSGVEQQKHDAPVAFEENMPNEAAPENDVGGQAVVTSVQGEPQLASVAPAEATTDTSNVNMPSAALSPGGQQVAESIRPVSPMQVRETIRIDETREPGHIPSGTTADHTQLPPMPEPLRAADSNASMLVEREQVDIMPNVTAKPVEADLQPEKGPEKKNYSMRVHENEYIAILKEVGGIAEDGIPLNKLWQEFVQRKDPSKGLPRPLDRRTVKIVATSLEKRGLIKRSILQFQGSDKMIQRPVIYLASITLEGPEMRDFAISMQEKMSDIIAGPKNWLLGRKTVHRTSNMAHASRSGPRRVEEVPTDARPFFLKNWRVVAQYFGWQYGFLARARTLHEYLISSITDDNDSAFIISSSSNIRIFSAPFVLQDTPLSVYLRVAAVSEYSEELEKLLQQEGAREMPIKQLPPELSGLFGTSTARGYGRFSQLFAALMALKLLVPLEQVDHESPIVAYSGSEREPRYFSAREDRSGATYWLLPSQAPVYDMQERKASEQRLLGQVPIVTPEQASHYWDTVHRLTFGATDASDLPPATVKYPATLNAPVSLIFSARSSTHWRSPYLLLAQQKTYLRRILDEAPSKDILLSDEQKLNQIAYNICAPVEVVKAYYAKPYQGARPEWAKRRKRRAGRKPVLDDSGTSASEPEGPAAPASRSQLAEKAEAKSLTHGKAAEDAAKLKQQQEIIALKARGVSQAKQAVWDGIVNGFRLQHGEEALQRVQLDFLHTWFLSPEGPTASAIQRHLEQAVEGVQSAPNTIPSWSTLTSKTGSIAHRGQGQKMDRRLVQRMAPEDFVEGPAKDFALYDLPELPEVQPSGEKKTPKTGWSPEEDEQLVDLYIILQSRANDRDTRLSLEPAVAFFSGTKPKLLVDRLRRIASRPGEVAYLDALQAAWSALWHNNRITDPLLHEAVRNATPEGLQLLRRVLNGLLNKQSLRFQAIMPADAAAASQTRLPANPQDLQESYLVEPRNSLENPQDSQTYSYLWSTITTAQKSIKFNYQPFCTSYAEQPPTQPMSSSERLQCFKTRYERLDRVSANCAKDANEFAKRLLDESEVEWPFICEDGDMMAIAHLFSDDLLKFSIDTSVTRAGRPYTDYRTRKTDDDNYENALTVQPNESFTEKILPLFRFPNEGTK